MTCVVWAENEANLQEYIEVAKAQIAAKSQSLQAGMKEYQLNQISEGVTCLVASWVYNEQNAYYNNKSQVDTAVTNLLTAMTTAQKEYMIGLEDEHVDVEEVEATIAVPTEWVVPEFSLKWVVLGLLVGMVGAAGVIVVITMLDGKLQSDGELTKRFGIRNIGAIENLAAISNSGKIYVLTSLKELPGDVAEKISASMEAGNATYEVVCGAGMASNQTIELTEDAKVVIVEELGNSKLKEIYCMAEWCKAAEVDVIGYVSIG